MPTRTTLNVEHYGAGFTADVLVDNAGMFRIFHKCGYAVESEMEGGEYHLTIPFDRKRKRRKRNVGSSRESGEV